MIVTSLWSVWFTASARMMKLVQNAGASSGRFSLLVPARRLLLGRLCNFLREFSEHHETTQMNCGNLSVCFAHLMQSSSVGALQHPQASKKDPKKWRLRRPSWVRNTKVKKPMS